VSQPHCRWRAFAPATTTVPNQCRNNVRWSRQSDTVDWQLPLSRAIRSEMSSYAGSTPVVVKGRPVNNPSQPQSNSAAVPFSQVLAPPPPQNVAQVYNHSAPVYNPTIAAPAVYSNNPPPSYNPTVPQDYTPAPGSGENKYNAGPRPCRDVIWGILFYAHLFVLLGLAVVYTPQLAQQVAEAQGGNGRRNLLSRFLQDQEEEQQDLQLDTGKLLSVLGFSSLLAALLTFASLGFMMTHAQGLVKTALIFNVCFFAFLTLLSLLTGAIPMVIMGLVMTGIAAYYAYRVWARIPFAAANLITAVAAVRSNMGLAVYAVLSLVGLFLWTIVWSLASVSTLAVTSNCEWNNEQQDAEDEDCLSNSGIPMFLFLISYYWTIQVLANVVHVTTAGTVGTWWMVPAEANGCCSSAVTSSYIRALTTSFGSICLGSLIVAILQALKEVLHNLRDNQDGAGAMLACCAECLLGIIEQLVEYFNKWAFGK